MSVLSPSLASLAQIDSRFEKSLYDLIRGLRSHKGQERAYIQNSIRECRREVRSQDMDLKATALLKLTYLEMFGHDMSWASFNVLEVMSSAKYPQKRVGYLSAVQSFRPDTEVLMLAENLLKKDLSSPSGPTMSLPLVAIPHVINPSMANSLLSDLLPRLSHSNPTIRKKTIVTLYRLAVVYPETLRPTWPRIKERLSDNTEDASVIAAIVNVVCELGWRRPQDFLPLAPRLFELLIEGTNNWMAIKIVKLFATLTPAEPRLIKKLLPPLTDIIKSTPAMSLLYECINGILQGGILRNASGTTEGDELARLCVGKLRGMLVIEGDPNLKYVALLAFCQIVEMHPDLISSHEDAILASIDDPDVSIRFKALELAVGMVNAQNLEAIVDRLMMQLRNSQVSSKPENPLEYRIAHEGIVPAADSDDETAEQSIHEDELRATQLPPLPDDYRVRIIHDIIEMCSRDTYVNVNDFDWYLDILVSLVRQISTTTPKTADADVSEEQQTSSKVGSELRNVAVRVKASRREATQAAESLLSIERRARLFPPSVSAGFGVLGPAAWIVGEYADLLSNPQGTINSLIHPDALLLPPSALTNYLQASLKVLVQIIGSQSQLWTSERKSMTLLLLGRCIHFFENLTTHSDVEIQELAVQHLELLRLANEASKVQDTDIDNPGFAEPPLLLTQAVPSLFSGTELKPVASNAQKQISVPNKLDLDTPINPDLPNLLQATSAPTWSDSGEADTAFAEYYYQRPQSIAAIPEPAATRLELPREESMPLSYQNGGITGTLDPEALAKRRAQRRERDKDDPFYIASPSERNSGVSTPVHDILKANNAVDLDIDSIPIMELNLEDEHLPSINKPRSRSPRKPAAKKNFEILGDESIADGSNNNQVQDRRRPSSLNPPTSRTDLKRTTSPHKRSLLELDSSGLGSLSLGESSAGRPNGGKASRNAASSKASQLDIERREAEEAEMEAAMKEVERLRLEMQRAQERIQSRTAEEDVPVVTKKKKKKKKSAKHSTGNEGDDSGNAEFRVGAVQEEDEGGGKKVKKEKKSKKDMEVLASSGGNEGEGEGTLSVEAEPTIKKKKKKKKRREVAFEDEGAAR